MNKKLLFYLVGFLSSFSAIIMLICLSDTEFPRLLSYVIIYTFSLIGVVIGDLLSKKGLSNNRRISKLEIVWGTILFGVWITIPPTIFMALIICEYLSSDYNSLLSMAVAFVYAVIFFVYVRLTKGRWYFENNYIEK